MENLNGHAAGNGGHSQGDPNSADRLFPYSAGILGGTMETAASFEVRNAPSSYPTAAGNGGYRQGDPKSADRLFPYSAFIVFKVRIISGSSIELVGPCVDD